MRVMGVDTSTKTGYVILDDAGDVAVSGVIHYKPMENRYQRFACYTKDIAALADVHGVDLVIIEGYSFAGKFNRMRLYKEGLPFVEVPPTSLKKFVTGKGNVKKDLMLLSVYKRWGYDTEDDNEADAYGLAQFGRALLGKNTTMPSANLTALEKVKLSTRVLKLIS
jgi:crossover junction endodeoxyribonuclease RuvC